MCSGKECQLLRRDGKTKQIEMPVTVLPNANNEQLLFVTLNFKPCEMQWLDKHFNRTERSRGCKACVSESNERN
jgi:hypothetical protein